MAPFALNVEGAVEGVLGLRRGGAVWPGLGRSDLGQAASKLAGGASLASGGGGAAGGLGRSSADRISGGNGSLVRVWARSRSFRDDEENNRLRFGLTAGSASAGSASGGASPRGRSRGAASSGHGGGPDGADGSTRPACSAVGSSRLNRKPPSPGAGGRSAPAGASGCTAASPCGSAEIPVPSRRATFFSSRTAIQRPSMIAPVQTPITPVRISVLPKLNSLTGIPKPIASRPAKTKPNPVKE